MMFWLALSAAFGCALCNGIAAVLQKISADKAARAKSLRPELFFHLLRDGPYAAGTVLDGLAWILTLVAVHSLALFVVQPIIASSVVITLVLESLVFHSKIPLQVVLAIGFIVLGLFLLAATSAPENSTPVHGAARLIIIMAPLLLAILGAVFVKFESRGAAMVLAAASGLAFGGTAIVGRMLRFSVPYWHVLASPLFIALVGYGFIGVLLFTIALQRQRASVVSAVMITFETLVPILVGLLFLGDSPRHGLWIVMIIGACLAVSGTVFIAADGNLEPAR